MGSRFDKFKERKGYDHNLFGMRAATRTDTHVLAVFKHSLNIPSTSPRIALSLSTLI